MDYSVEQNMMAVSMNGIARTVQSFSCMIVYVHIPVPLYPLVVAGSLTMNNTNNWQAIILPISCLSVLLYLLLLP